MGRADSLHPFRGGLRDDDRAVVVKLDALDEVHRVGAPDVVVGGDQRAPGLGEIADREPATPRNLLERLDTRGRYTTSARYPSTAASRTSVATRTPGHSSLPARQYVRQL